jgi:hypothetical protein
MEYSEQDTLYSMGITGYKGLFSCLCDKGWDRCKRQSHYLSDILYHPVVTNHEMGLHFVDNYLMWRFRSRILPIKLLARLSMLSRQGYSR